VPMFFECTCYAGAICSYGFKGLRISGLFGSNYSAARPAAACHNGTAPV
jgi:hypothetical protein